MARAFGLFEVMADDLINPAGTLASETAILAMEFEALGRSFPEGPWGTMILESLGSTPQEDEKENRKQAVAACVKAGVPREVFESVKSFRKYLAELKELELRFAEAAAACMQLPPKARVERGQRLYERYTKAVGAIGRPGLLDPVDVGVMYAGHEAKIAIVRLALAVSAGRSDKGFPQELADVASGFGGDPPASPYDGSPVRYERLDDGKSFRLAIDEVRVGKNVLPGVDFTTSTPTDAK